MKRQTRATNGHRTEPPTTAAKPRLQIPCTDQQRQILIDAAADARSDLNTWALAHLVRAAKRPAAGSSPIVIGGDVAYRVRELAKAQGIAPDELIAQLLVAGEA